MFLYEENDQTLLNIKKNTNSTAVVKENSYILKVSFSFK